MNALMDRTLTRRSLLTASGAALLISGVASLLAACDETDPEDDGEAVQAEEASDDDASEASASEDELEDDEEPDEESVEEDDDAGDVPPADANGTILAVEVMNPDEPTSERNGRIVWWNQETDEREPVLPDFDERVNYARSSPDGQRILVSTMLEPRLFEDEHGSEEMIHHPLWLLNMETLEIFPVEDPEDDFSHFNDFGWSLDGQHFFGLLYYGYSRRVRLYDRDATFIGEAERLLPQYDGTEEPYGALPFWCGSQGLIFRESALVQMDHGRIGLSGVGLLDLNGQTHLLVPDETVGEFGERSATPLMCNVGGTHVGFDTHIWNWHEDQDFTERLQAVGVLELDTGEVTLSEFEQRDYSPRAWSPDGRFIAAWSELPYDPFDNGFDNREIDDRLVIFDTETLEKVFEGPSVQGRRIPGFHDGAVIYETGPTRFESSDELQYFRVDLEHFEITEIDASIMEEFTDPYRLPIIDSNAS